MFGKLLKFGRGRLYRWKNFLVLVREVYNFMVERSPDPAVRRAALRN
jgi:hypothetical protein